jgi:ketopantoate reductase
MVMRICIIGAGAMDIRVIGIKYSKLKSSSLQSLERGRLTEVENYNG